MRHALSFSIILATVACESIAPPQPEQASSPADAPPPPILPDVPSTAGVTILRGSAGVDAFGGASYTLPIEQPPGRGGMTPRMALQYGSNSGQGHAGVGWSLQVESVIVPCNKIIAIDGQADGADLDGFDALCMDGQRLIGPYGGPYRLERDDLTEVTASTRSGSRGSSSWNAESFLVKHPDGRESVYDARYDAPNGRARAYYRTSTTDTSGNTIRYHYARLNSPLRTNDLGVDTYFIRLEAVEYTSNDGRGGGVALPASRRVELVYGSVAGATAGLGFADGGGIDVSNVVRRVEVTVDGHLAYAYALTYAASPSSQRPLLESVRRCDALAVCGDAVRFTYSGGGAPSFALGANLSIPADRVDAPAVADIDGDGMVDVAYLVRAGSEKRIAIHWGGRVGGAFVLGASTEIATGVSSVRSMSLTDYDADGFTDVLIATDTGYEVLRSTGPGRSFTRPTPPGGSSVGLHLWGDFDGDGRVDYAACQNGTWHAWRNDPAVAVPTPLDLQFPCVAGDMPLVMDADGDGSSELAAGLVRAGHPVELGIGGLNRRLTWSPLPIIEPIEGYHWIPQGATLTELTGTTHIPRSYVGDFNGDGLADFLFPDQVTTEQVPVGAFVFLSTGAGVLHMIGAFSITSTPPRAYEMADVNADARTDHILAWNDRLEVRLTGNLESRRADGQLLGELDVPLPAGTDVVGVDAVDMNADGSLDLVVTRRDEVLVLLQDVGRPDLLEKVHETRAARATTRFAYDTLATAAIYDAGGCTSSYPVQCVRPSSMLVVKELAMDMGAQHGPHVQTYRYVRGRRDAGGRGFLGFEQITVTDVETGATRSDDYGVPLGHGPTRFYASTGQPQSVRIRTPLADGTAMVTETTHQTFVEPTTTDGRTRYRVHGSRDESRERVEGTTPVRSSRTDVIEMRDARGFPSLVRTTWNDGDHRETITTYHHDANIHVYGLPRTQVIIDHTRVDGQWHMAEQAFSWQYDSRGRVESATTRAATDPLRLTTTYRYDGYGNVENVSRSSVADGTRSTTAEHLDPDRMFATRVTNPLGHVSTFDYHPVFGTLRRSVDANGELNDYAYDGFGLMRLLIRPPGLVTSFHRDVAAGDDIHHREVTQAPGAPAVTEDIDHLGRAIAATSYGFDGRMIHRSFSYDGRGRPSTASGWYYRGDAGRDFVRTEYDALDRVTVREQADGQRVDIRYEPSGRPDGSGEAVVQTDVLGRATRTVFDGRGRIREVRDAQQGTLTHAYGSFGWPVWSQDPTGAITRVDWDPYGYRRWIDDPSQGRMSFEYDAFGDVKTWTDGANVTFSVARDAIGRPLSRDVVGTSQRDEWVYDEPFTDGCRRSARVPGKNPHSIGRLTCARSADGHSVEHTFDTAGRARSTTYRVGSRVMSYAHSYDAEGRVEQLQYPESIPDRRLSVRYRYQNGLVSRAEVASTGHVLWQREAAEASGATIRSTSGNGVRTSRTFRPMGGTASEQHVGLTGQALFDMAYDYDRAGNLLAQRDMRQAMRERYSYDELHRLRGGCIETSVEPVSEDTGLPKPPSWPLPESVSWPFDKEGPLAATADQLTRWRNFAQSPHAGASKVQVVRSLGVPVTSEGALPSSRGPTPACVEFRYDGIGNLQSSTDRGTLRYPATRPSGLPIAHAPDRVTKPDGTIVALSYDEAGRLTSAGPDRFEWTASGKLRRVVGSPSLLSANETFYEYDPDGGRARIQRPFGSTVFAGGLYERTESQSLQSPRETWSAAGTVSKYIVEVGGAVVAEITEHETAYTQVRRGAPAQVWSDAGGPLSTTALDKVGLFVRGAWTIAYLHADRVGSIVLVTDDAGDVVDRKNYDAFGWARSPNWRGGNGASAFGQQSVGFAEGIEDPGSGWIAMGARMYVPWLARFASPDPLIGGIGTQSRARYAYARNNPLRWKDTTGLDAEPVDVIHPTKTVHGEWPEHVVSVRRPILPIDDAGSGTEPPPPPPPPPPQGSGKVEPMFRAPGLTQYTRGAMAHNRAVFNAKVREQTEKMSWKDKVKTTATVVGVAGAFIPVVGDAISLAASVAIFAVEPTAENALGVVGDAAGLVVPGMPGLGAVKRAGEMAHDASNMTNVVDAVHDAGNVADAAKAGERAEEAATLGKGVDAAAEGGVPPPNRIYSARELVRRAEEPGPFHNFPETFNDQIFNEGSRKVTPDFWRKTKPGLSNDSVMYELRGSVNGIEGTYEIGTRPSVSGRSEVILHRFFRPDR